MTNNALIIYQASTGAIELPIDATSETIWATQKQIAEVFDVTPQNITQHLASIYSEGEMDETATCKESLQVRKEGDREIRRTVKLYDLDVIIAVGYRINSSRGTSFRKWATRTLRGYLTEGYAINPTRIEHNRTQFTKALEDLKLISTKTTMLDATGATDLALAFATTWFSLDAYDKSKLPVGGTIRQVLTLGANDLQTELAHLKAQLIREDEATELFATERDGGGLYALFNDIFQTFDGADVYPTVEEKAAHLLYFTVKNHVFVDGNMSSSRFLQHSF